MCFKVQTPVVVERSKPKIEILAMPWTYAIREVMEGNLKLLYPGLLDTTYYYTTANDWGEVFNWIYFEFKMPQYLTDRMDCDDFSMLLKGLVASFFGLNYFGAVFGQTPAGYHSWNVFRTEDAVMQFEPQLGEVIEMRSGGYLGEWVLL